MGGRGMVGTRVERIGPLGGTRVERKGRAKEELDQVVGWLTGYDEQARAATIDEEIDLETSFARAPARNPNAGLITGLICGIRVEQIEDPLMQQIRWMDKLVDEVARGKRMQSILRS